MNEPALTEEAAAPLPCPFCGSDQLLVGSWHVDDGEFGGLACSKCYGGAPVTAWNTRHSPTLEATPAWHYPQSNLDLENLPEPGEKVVGYYYDGESIRGPVLITPVSENGPLVDDKGFSVYCPIVRWCSIPPDEVRAEDVEEMECVQ